MQNTNFVISEQTLRYLKGDILSNGSLFQLVNSGGGVVSRDAWLVAETAGQRVIHMGCADHIELIDRKRKAGNYLHDALTANCSVVVGVDVNEAALDEMKRNGIEGLFTVDQFDKKRAFDVMVVSDVIEHVGNVANFLADLKKYNCKKYIFTTPNAYRPYVLT
jgi:2-polyprenyl-3-methyl-5-hydroxy-6-metoxy-1,4-benzoquinol methylase